MYRLLLTNDLGYQNKNVSNDIYWCTVEYQRNWTFR